MTFTDGPMDPINHPVGKRVIKELKSRKYLAVIGSSYQNPSKDFGESCQYFDYYIFTKEGVVMRLTTDHTD